MLERCPNNVILKKKIVVSMTLCSALALPQSLLAQSTADDNANALSEVVVSATRSETPVSKLTRSVTVIDREEIETQASLDQDLGSILAQTVPGMSPSTEALSNFGQSLRGRNFQVLIDGVPQSTPLRDGFRDLNTINPAAIERIEIVRGGTAVYGFDAGGGLVNIITKKPSDQKLAGYSEAGVSFSTEHIDSSGELTTNHRVSGTSGQLDYLASGAFTTRDDRFDSKGRRIPPDPQGNQVGLADSDEYNLIGKIGYNFDNNRQRIDAMVNYYDIEQETDYVGGYFGAFGAPSLSTTNSDPLPNSRRTPAIPIDDAIPGSTNSIDPGTENIVANINYMHDDFLGNKLKLNTYYGDQAASFSKFPGSPQSEIKSEKLGARLTIDTPLDFDGYKANVMWGMDYINDETSQIQFGPNATDPVTLDEDAIAGFAELELPLGEYGLLRGGVRHEDINIDAATIQQNRSGNTVLGGELELSETLFNLSTVFYLTDYLDLFASYSEGFSLSDIARTLDDAGTFGAGETLRASDFETKAEQVDNYEIGLRGYNGPWQYSIVGFYSESDDGATFNQSNQTVLIQRASEKIWGIEGSMDYRFNSRWKAGGTFSWADGEVETANGDVDLPNTRISPEKLTAYIDYSPTKEWMNRLQFQYIGDRSTDISGFGHGDVDSYTVVDLVSRVAIGPGHLRLTAENLFNENYFPAVNQAFDTVYAYAKGPGRRVGLSYAVSW
ncbi:iron complex outermembrane receptor protein [Methylohalomonas lacus]|uniref:Iron complex outermembrane receptor protein n=1 Tax=Methylohalomonas lacus TaxID=398773 RepID=A0AAE3HKJ2_9GAMM|nr:TonB-dependent receptor [Methylohalomonas lacus]MCS3903485.1 iron complex outermembrane receptor protein [Methylohalomonas lacus]